ncbi:MAG: ParB N-terminal domain-containing protein [Thermomonas sp.]|uniref:ParB N-terminal domain-containing protein n=1 Tax=Thermomonas sp. TaxID=1971895 RepID=UPI002616C6D1|nr:ParB N-terminal domain-containing protein [Thermomonas sp.]MCC7097308.1 ParB N-terminal domain-containing protein [Thermomonas sp.]
MASKSSTPDTAEATAPDVVGQIILLRPDEIEAGERLRPVDPVWAEALAGILKAEGQRTPIEVCRLPGKSRYTLVTGAHRHAAAAKAGLWLRAEVVTNDAAERRLREISENMHRRDLAPLDRAAMLAELVAVHKVRAGLDPNADGRTASVNARWQKALQNEAVDTNDTMTFVYGWSEQVADELGFSKRTIERDLLLHRRLPAMGVAQLREVAHPILNNAAQLRALAKLDDGTQRKVIRRLADGARTIAEAIDAKTAQPADAKRLSAFIGAFGRMSLSEKKGALAQLAGMLPAGWSLTGPEAGQ